jgi:hypothetical protein
MGQQTFKRIPSQSSWRKILKPTKSYFLAASAEDSKEQAGRFKNDPSFLQRCVFSLESSPAPTGDKDGSRNSMESRSLRFAPAIS